VRERRERRSHERPERQLGDAQVTFGAVQAADDGVAVMASQGQRRERARAGKGVLGGACRDKGTILGAVSE